MIVGRLQRTAGVVHRAEDRDLFAAGAKDHSEGARGRSQALGDVGAATQEVFVRRREGPSQSSPVPKVAARRRPRSVALVWRLSVPPLFRPDLFGAINVATMIVGAKNARGRPKTDTEPVNIRMSRAQVAAIDGWIARVGGAKITRAEAARRLIDLALSAAESSGAAVSVKLAPEMLAELDAWIAAHDDAMNRPAAIRAFLSASLFKPSPPKSQID
jgi:hypothetical protein